MKITCSVDGIEYIEREIRYVELINTLSNSKTFTDFLKEKVMATLNQVMSERLIGTTNEEYIEEYKLRNKIEDIPNGFVLYNDFTIPYVMTSKNNSKSDYSNGFSIALAFEYGTGIVGQENPKEGAWEYNKNNWQTGWYYRTRNGEVVKTKGYEGMEIYRFTKANVEKNLSAWLEEYLKRNEVNNG